ncbi:hypothetical protein [Microbacterium sp. NPDC089696]|uniref:hypothetical protein n=1 Tax=Microbacterium sp. NPDC089696 TaxID=3364199 RepID=UPI00382BDFFB
MPTQNARKHVVPTGGEQSISRATIYQAFANSIHDVVPVANTTERGQVVAALTAAGLPPSAANPLIVYRADAPGLHKLEINTGGALWLGADGSMRFADSAALDTWTATNPGLLVAGDRAWVGSLSYVYTGTQWLIAPGQQLGYMVSSTSSGVINSQLGTVVSTPKLPVNQPLKIFCSRVSGSASAAGPIAYAMAMRNNAADVTAAANDRSVVTRAYQNGGGLVMSIPGAVTRFVTSTAEKVTAALYLGAGGWISFGADQQELWIESA